MQSHTPPPPTGGDTAPKLHIDTDWKAQAQAEKERLAKAEQAKAKPSKAGGPPGQGGEPLPEPTFQSLVGMLASQAIMGLGMMMDKQTKRVVVDLEGSRFNIDLLEMLEAKTKGNLAPDESKELGQILAELRSRYVQLSQLVAEQLAKQGSGAPVVGGTPLPGHATSGGPVIL